eukprot:361014-Chlamydomonas_euryale.AAC.4
MSITYLEAKKHYEAWLVLLHACFVSLASFRSPYMRMGIPKLNLLLVPEPDCAPKGAVEHGLSPSCLPSGASHCHYEQE